LRAADAPQTGKPNIVFIMADDLGWGEVIQQEAVFKRQWTPNTEYPMYSLMKKVKP
jgi:arylsulfatase A-like enzyme